MEGPEFGEQRKKIENSYVEINEMIAKRDIQNAKKNIEQALKTLSELSTIVLGNKIQERSVWNMEVKGQHLYKKISNL